MKRRSQWALLPFAWRQGLIGGLSVASLGLVIWVSSVSWSCPQRSLLGPADLVCLSPWEWIAPLSVALVFWIMGLLGWLVIRTVTTSGFFFLSASVLISGLLSSMGSYAGARLFYALLAWLAPTSFRFFLSLLSRPSTRAEKGILGVLLALAVVLSFPFLSFSILTLQAEGWYGMLRIAIRLAISFALIAGISALLWSYLHDASLAARRRIRLLAFGTALAFAPVLLLSVLPDTLGVSGHVPYEYTLPWLLLSPLTYVYSLYRHQLVRFESVFSRTAASYLLITVLLCVYMVAAAALSHPANPLAHSPMVGALLSLILLIAFVGLQKGLGRVTRWALYGRETAARDMVNRLTEALSLTLDRRTLQSLLTEQLAEAMHLSSCCLFLKDLSETLVLNGQVGFESGALTDCHLPTNAALVAFLEIAARPLSGAEVRRALRGKSLSTAERTLLASGSSTLWLPLISGGKLQGLALLGAKTQDDFFDAEEQTSLAALARQSGIASHNVRLMDQIGVAQRELARAHQQLLAGRERERREIAQELHDGIVQQLLGISYQLANAGRGTGGKTAAEGGCPPEMDPSPWVIRQELLGVVRQLRGLIGELRPAGLEELGLSAALEGYVSHLKRDGGEDMPVIELIIDRDGADLPGSVSTCLFRVAQEGLRNALEHGRAESIRLILRFSDDEVTLIVTDDGCGFRVPARLTELIQSDHFGLVGIAERVAWAGGRLVIVSEPGTGTALTVHIPLSEMEQDLD